MAARCGHAPLGILRSNNAEGNENVNKKTICLISKKQLCTCITFFFGKFLSCFCTTKTWKYLISLRFMDDVNKQLNDEFFFSLSELPWIWSLEILSGGFSYIWQSKWVGIIAIKTIGTQINFLSNVPVAVESLDLKVPIYKSILLLRDVVTHIDNSCYKNWHQYS